MRNPFFLEFVTQGFGITKTFPFPFQVCPWTLFLTLTLTLLKGSLPYLPSMLPAVIPDKATRARAVEILESEDFKDNIDKYFIENVKVTNKKQYIKSA